MKRRYSLPLAFMTTLALFFGLAPTAAFAAQDLQAVDAGASLAAQAGTVIKTVDVTMTPPKAGETGDSTVVNLEEGSASASTSVSFTLPSASGCLVEAYGYCQKDESDLTAPVTFKAGETYYLWVTLKAKSGNTLSDDLQANLTGGKLLNSVDVYTYGDYSAAPLLISFNPVAVQEKQVITASNKTVRVKKTVKLGAKTSGDGALTYASSNTAVATVSAKGVITGKKAGTAKITIKAAETDAYKQAVKTVKVTVKKRTNPLVLQKATVTVKYLVVKSKAKVSAPKIVKTAGKGTVTFTRSAVTAKYKKYVTVNAKTGKITVKKGAPKGTCTLKVKVKASGNATYLSAAKTVTVKITVK